MLQAGIIPQSWQAGRQAQFHNYVRSFCGPPVGQTPHQTLFIHTRARASFSVSVG